MRAPLRLLAAASLATTATLPLAAQGGPPPGGGMGGMGGGMQRMMQSVSLQPLLAGVPSITDAQKAALTKIEDKMKNDLTEAAGAIRDMMMAARQSGEQPDRTEMMKVRDAMQKTREQAWADARATLTDAQRPTFDANLKAMKEEEAKRAAEMRGRMGGGAPPAGA